MSPVNLAQQLAYPDVPAAGVLWVSGGAIAAGVTGDAVAVVNAGELRRRRACGLGELSSSLALLTALLELPLCTPVRSSTLSPATLARLAAAPASCVEFTGATVTRLAEPPVTVAAAVANAGSWRASFATALALRPMCRAYVLVGSEIDLREHIWEAQTAGVGVLIAPTNGADATETLPAPAYGKPMKPARWRFAERAWAAATAAAHC